MSLALLPEIPPKYFALETFGPWDFSGRPAITSLWFHFVGKRSGSRLVTCRLTSVRFGHLAGGLGFKNEMVLGSFGSRHLPDHRSRLCGWAGCGRAVLRRSMGRHVNRALVRRSFATVAEIGGPLARIRIATSNGARGGWEPVVSQLSNGRWIYRLR
jgi:hypothetical protein